MNQSTSDLSAKELRKIIRQRRKALSAEQQLEAANLLANSLIQNLPKNVKSIAIYLTNDGEIDPIFFIEACWKRSISVCLPVLHPFNSGQLLFLNYHSKSVMQANIYGIAEPTLDVRNVVPVKNIDIIYTPLVAFDAQGNRMGMGGGYYDRTLAVNPQVIAIGIAHDCQQVDALTPQSWDVPLSQIITPTQQIVPHKDV